MPAPRKVTLVVTNASVYTFSPVQRIGGANFIIYNSYQRVPLASVVVVSLPYTESADATYALRSNEIVLHLEDGRNVWCYCEQTEEPLGDAKEASGGVKSTSSSSSSPQEPSAAPRRSMIAEVLSDCYSRLVGNALPLDYPAHTCLLREVVCASAQLHARMQAIGRESHSKREDVQALGWLWLAHSDVSAANSGKKQKQKPKPHIPKSPLQQAIDRAEGRLPASNAHGSPTAHRRYVTCVCECVRSFVWSYSLFTSYVHIYTIRNTEAVQLAW